jgi:hypothetical protein
MSRRPTITSNVWMKNRNNLKKEKIIKERKDKEKRKRNKTNFKMVAMNTRISMVSSLIKMKITAST